MSMYVVVVMVDFGHSARTAMVFLCVLGRGVYTVYGNPREEGGESLLPLAANGVSPCV